MSEKYRKQYLKTGIALLVTVGICSWVACRLIWPDRTVRYNDFVTDSAVEWLENADDGDFNDCRKDIVDKDGWFDWFVKDRKSLDANKSRVLCSKKETSGASAGMKRYELKFIAKFSVMKYPKSRVMEHMIVETDGKRQFKVLMADYWLSNGFYEKALVVSEEEKTTILSEANKALNRIIAGDTDFFIRVYSKQLQKEPDYFGWQRYKKRDLEKLKSGKFQIMQLLKNKNPQEIKRIELKTFASIGKTGFECSAVSYAFSAKDNGVDKNFVLHIFVDRDLYQNKSAKWEYNALLFYEDKKKKQE